jgi:hypothetical protein
MRKLLPRWLRYLLPGRMRKLLPGEVTAGIRAASNLT